MTLSFVVFARPEPQGSMRAFMPKGKKFPVVTSDNKDLRSYRQEVSRTAMVECGGQPAIEKHIPVMLELRFFLQRPPSIPKRRIALVVRPDVDKLCRATIDALAGIAFVDDAQVISLSASKQYGSPERVEVTIHVGEASIDRSSSN